MKRLLSYLFIVLGLGLAFNSHANAKAPSKYICFGQKDNTHYYLDWYNWSYGYSWWNADCKKNGNLISKSKNPNQFDTLKSKINLSGKKISSDGQHRLILKKESFHKLFTQLGLDPGFDLKTNNDNSNQSNNLAKRNVGFCQHKESRSNLYISNSSECWNNKYRIISENEYVVSFLYRFGGSTTTAYQNALNTLYTDYRRNNLKINRIHKIIKSNGQLKAYLPIIDKSKTTQVAKKEKKDSHNTYKCGSKDWLGNTVCGEDWDKKQITKNDKTLNYSGGGKYIGETQNGKPHGQGIFTWSNGDKYEGNFENGKFNGSGYVVFAKTGDVLVGIYKNGKIIDGDAEVYDSSGKYSKTWVYGNSTVIREKNEWLKKRKKTLADALEENNLKIKDTETVIVKKEPKKKENKSQKVVKVSEKDQKEIKIKTKEFDTEGPKIQIAETITVDESNYNLKGKVSDAGSDKIYLKIDGQDVPLKNGKFNVSRYSPNDEKIKIVAIDKWGNKSTKMIKVIVDIQEETVVKKLEPLNPSSIKAKTTGEKVALIIGIENYTEAPKANYANLDAKYFFDYARKGFGIKKQNINLLVDENATFVKTSKALTLWLKTKIKANQTDLVVFFAGHGLASNDGKELYLLPQDSDPNLLDITALSRTKLFKTIIDLKPKSVTMFLDTCYSGVSRDEQTLLASARPIRIMVDEQEGIPNNFTIFTASQVEQISSGIKEAKHGIFSYYLMKGLEGKADSNNDKKITNGELLAYMDEKVSQKAAELGRPQNPSLAGDPDRVLISYR